MVASVLVALFPRPYAKWFSVLSAAVSTVCTIALASEFQLAPACPTLRSP